MERQTVEFGTVESRGASCDGRPGCRRRRQDTGLPRIARQIAHNGYVGDRLARVGESERWEA